VIFVLILKEFIFQVDGNCLISMIHFWLSRHWDIETFVLVLIDHIFMAIAWYPWSIFGVASDLIIIMISMILPWASVLDQDFFTWPRTSLAIKIDLMVLADYIKLESIISTCQEKSCLHAVTCSTVKIMLYV